MANRKTLLLSDGEYPFRTFPVRLRCTPRREKADRVSGPGRRSSRFRLHEERTEVLKRQRSCLSDQPRFAKLREMHFVNRASERLFRPAIWGPENGEIHGIFGPPSWLRRW